MPRNIVGNVVEGADFVDRTHELARLWDEGLLQNLLLLAPRRVGKTSLLHRLVRKANEEPGTRGVYLSAEDVVSELDFAEKLYDTLADVPGSNAVRRKSLKRAATKLLAAIKSVKMAPVGLDFDHKTTGHWSALGRELSESLGADEGHWFICVDELPLFVLQLLRDGPDGSHARRFLQWFRHLRRKPPEKTHNVHWVLAGSIGLDTVASRFQLTDTINDLKLVRLGPFTQENAEMMLKLLGEQHKIALDHVTCTRILEVAGWPIPYHLQLMFAEVRELCEERGSPFVPTIPLIEQAFESLVRKASYFDFWAQRLTEELGRPHDQWAKQLLDASARDPLGATRSVLEQVLARHVSEPDERERELRWLRDVLVNDGYLVEENGRYPFRSNLLREFWLRRYVQ